MGSVNSWLMMGLSCAVLYCSSIFFLFFSMHATSRTVCFHFPSLFLAFRVLCIFSPFLSFPSAHPSLSLCRLSPRPRLLHRARQTIRSCLMTHFLPQVALMAVVAVFLWQVLSPWTMWQWRCWRGSVAVVMVVTWIGAPCLESSYLCLSQGCCWYSFIATR